MTNERSFQRILREQVVAQANLLEALTAHPTLVGAGRERAVIDMLRGQLPRRYEVLTGTVLGQDDDGTWQRENRQLDVMVVDTFDYPTLLRNGDLAVVLPQAVRVVIEVKSDLRAPPDPDDARPSSEPVPTGDDDEPSSEGERAEAQSTKKKETFLGAIKQISTNRLLFGQKPVFTILLSHRYPKGNYTLRTWLERVVKTRRKLRAVLSSQERSSKEYLLMEQEAQLLEASSLPDVIIADKGAIATRDGSKYTFFIAGREGGKKPQVAPALMSLVSYVVEQLEHGDPVVQLMRHEKRYESLRALREEGHKLFRGVMAPGLELDEQNPPLEVGEPPPEPDYGSAYNHLMGDDPFEPVEPYQGATENNISPKKEDT